MTSTADLMKRAEIRKQELIKTLRDLKDSAADEAVAERDAIRRRLSELGHALKDSATEGGEEVDDVAKARIERWLEN